MNEVIKKTPFRFSQLIKEYPKFTGKLILYFDKKVEAGNSMFPGTYYLKNGTYHREDGPAIEQADGDKGWYLNGWPHREDGPAIEWGNGDLSYYIHGKRMTKKEFKIWQRSRKLDSFFSVSPD